MLGIRLPAEAEERLERHARDAGRPKSVIARDWILQRLEREDVDELIRRAARLHATGWTDADRRRANANSDAHLSALDSEDGGYDWGPAGPPPPR